MRIAVLIVTLASSLTAFADPPADFRDLCAKRAADGDTMAIAGSNGWLFLRSELRHIGVGSFWGEAAAKVSRASKPELADPLPAIVDFHEQLQKRGIELLVMPVPCKAFLYPEQLGGAADGRLDTVQQEFFTLLTAKGVKVLDLAEAFQAVKTKPGTPNLYCQTDTHWSPYACEVTAGLIRQRLGLPGATGAFKVRAEKRTITGDLAEGKGTEELPARVVESTDGSPMEDKASAIVLLGDSHTLVFHAGGELHGTGAGLADQLAAELGVAVDVVGVRGSGATAARVNLLRRAKANPAYLAGKKTILWCFAAREFTEAQGWNKVPL